MTVCFRRPAIAALATLLSLSITSSAVAESKDPRETTPSIGVAFAGGGWRAHVGHTGWILALLDNGQNKLADVMVNVETVSANSGGSWFSTMLMYSPEFVAAIEDSEALSTWADSGPNATGWLGQQRYLFDQTPCHLLKGVYFFECVLLYYSGHATEWKPFIEKVVFKNFAIDEVLGGVRQPWSVDKDLLLAASMLTTNVVLSGSAIGDKQYYEACHSPVQPDLDGDGGATCGGHEPPDVTPISFHSPGRGTELQPLRFFGALSADSGTDYLNVGYTENSKKSPPVERVKLSNPQISAKIPVVTAAAASSAASGFGASETVAGHWESSYAIADAALSFGLTGVAKYEAADGLSVQELATKQIVRIADGGAVDNSGVAQLVRFLQQNEQADNFQIVAFDNAVEGFSPGGSAPDIGGALSNLFGKGVSSGNRYCQSQHCVQTPGLQIFDADTLSTPEVTWSAVANAGEASKTIQKIVYTRYTVTTTENSGLGISAGTTGTLHAFSCIWSNADAAPTNSLKKDSDFEAYEDMLKFISAGLREHGNSGKTGLYYLRTALGL